MRYSSLFSWATTLWFAVLSLMTVGCRSVVRVPETAQATTQPAAVFPDYRDVVIPPNIAPLNFQVNQPAEEIVVQVAGKRGTPLVAAAGEAGKLRFDSLEWRRLLNDHRGERLAVTVYTMNAGQWQRHPDWYWTVAQEPIDCGLQADGAEDGTLLDQSVGMLRHSHRFGADSGIGRLAALVNDGEVARVQRLWDEVRAGCASGQVPDIARTEVDAERWDALRQLVVHGRLDGVPADQGPVGYAHYLRWMHRNRPADGAGQDSFDEWAAGVLQAHGRFQLLCALRQGSWGVERQIALWLQSAGLLAASEGWYAGRPGIVTRNDYELGLMNGDVGIALAAQGGRLRVAFPAEGGCRGIRWVLPSRLQAAETVFAMTVHKAQGSEFDHAALAMPAELSPVLTRELVYTAITRARHFFTLVGPDGLDGVLGQAIRRRVLRASGLMAGALQAKD